MYKQLLQPAITVKPHALVALLLLSACGGTGGGDDTAAPGIPFAQFAMGANTAIDTYLDTTGNVTSGFAAIDSASIPTTGVVAYDGFLRGTLDGDALVGNLQITSDFVQSEITGTANGFRSADGTNFSGALTGDAAINRATGSVTPQILLTLDGTLNGASSTLALDGSFVVVSGETTIQSVAGQVEGSIAGTALNDGAFVAE